MMGGGGGGRGRTRDIFARECATLLSLYRPFLEFLTKRWVPFQNFCAQWRSPKYDFEGCFGEKMASIFQTFP